VKDCWPEELLLLLLELAGRRSAQGTATCLPLPEELLVLLVVDELEEPPVIERIAKSTFPEVGLIMMSLIVPILSPEDEVTEALVSWLPLTS
jgi:hypothetical protein